MSPLNVPAPEPVELLLLAAWLYLRGRGGGSPRLPGVRRPIRFLLRRPRTACLAMGVGGFALAAGLALARGGYPSARVSDEWSHLLAADTFAHGRLANPPHPLWPAFETFQVVQQPAYASRFPPGQGLVLALGQTVFGHPAWGLWLSVGLACAAITWALQVWLGPRWALIGGALATFHVAWSYWGFSYWGGALTAAGGALLLGSIRLLLRRPSRGAGLLLGGGLSILAVTRPWEGLGLSVPLLLALGAAHLTGRARLSRRTIANVLLGLAPLSILVIAHDKAVTGHAWLPPYLHYEQLYARTPPLGGAERTASDYRHTDLRNFFLGVPRDEPRPHWHHPSRLDMVPRTLAQGWEFFLGIPLSIPLLATALAWRRPGMKLSALGVLGTLLALFLYGPFFPHYAAPATALVLLWVTAGLRELRYRLLAPRVAGALIEALLLATMAGQALRVAGDERFWSPWPERATIVKQLRQVPGRDLVLVDYAPDYDGKLPWVVNGADIDAQSIVWAHDMGAAGDRELESYYHDRTAWHLEVRDLTTPRLTRVRDAPP